VITSSRNRDINNKYNYIKKSTVSDKPLSNKSLFVKGLSNKAAKQNRTNLYKGVINITPEIYNKLKKKPITRIICRKLGLISDSDVVPYLNLDTSFESYYNMELTKQLIPEEFQEYVIERLNKYAKPMNEKHLNVLNNLDLSSLVIS
jgi:hypothetical protein